MSLTSKLPFTLYMYWPLELFGKKKGTAIPDLILTLKKQTLFSIH